jgi:hypothetical protein
LPFVAGVGGGGMFVAPGSVFTFSITGLTGSAIDPSLKLAPRGSR